MEKLTSKEFVNTLFEIWNDPDRRICFVLGAGASKSSGIRTGGELAKQWLDDIKERMSDQPGKFKRFLNEKNINEENSALYYPLIYSEKYKFDKDSGFKFINNEMENAKPGYGYSVLAQMIADRQHNIVITTNFDNLTEEALYTYTSGRPLICGHESLAVFAKPSVKRPLIVKIHRDRYFNPQSQTQEIKEMSELWVDALNNIFSASTPVFIGYGGNDGSLMGYMEKVTRINNLFWCERRGSEISPRVEDLVKKRNGNLVEIEGFDELMFLLQAKLNLKLLNEHVVNLAQERAKEYRDTFERISKTQSKSADENVQQAAATIIEQTDDNNWWSWQLKADAAKTNYEKEVIYKEGLNKVPKSAELNGNYAVFLKNIRKNYDEAEKYYKKSLEIDPENANYNGNYALFLDDIRKNYDEAEKYYSNALKIDPENANNNGNYAVFLTDVRKNYDEAEKYYKKALKIDAESANKNGNYAGFLFEQGKKEKALFYLDEAFKYCLQSHTLSELWFYKYAHVENEKELSLKNLRQLICDKKVRSLDFNLQNNVDRAIKDGHPKPELLQQIADIITKDAPADEFCEMNFGDT